MPAPAYQAPRWLANPHLQTIYGSVFAAKPAVAYRRERWETPDGDFVDTDHVDGKDDAPRVLLFHGLEGSSDSAYARAPLANPRNDAQAIAVSLTKAGFAVTTLTDADLGGMREAILAFGRRLRGSDRIGLFYYAGHGGEGDGEPGHGGWPGAGGPRWRAGSRADARRPGPLTPLDGGRRPQRGREGTALRHSRIAGARRRDQHRVAGAGGRAAR